MHRVHAGQAVAGSSAYAKGVSLGIIEPRPDLVRERLAEGEQLHVDLLGRAVPVVQPPDGLRAVNKGKPCNSAQCEKYLAGNFGVHLELARTAMAELAAVHEPVDLNRRGFRLYEVPARGAGWRVKGGVRWASWTSRRCAGPGCEPRLLVVG